MRIVPARVVIANVSASVHPRRRRYMNASRAPLPESSGLGSVRVEDPQTGDMVGASGVGSSSRIPSEETPVWGGADGPDPGFGQLKRERIALDDQIVVAEGLPLLEVHTGAV